MPNSPQLLHSFPAFPLAHQPVDHMTSIHSHQNGEGRPHCPTYVFYNFFQRWWGKASLPCSWEVGWWQEHCVTFQSWKQLRAMRTQEQVEAWLGPELLSSLFATLRIRNLLSYLSSYAWCSPSSWHPESKVDLVC